MRWFRCETKKEGVSQGGVKKAVKEMGNSLMKVEVELGSR